MDRQIGRVRDQLIEKATDQFSRTAALNGCRKTVDQHLGPRTEVGAVDDQTKLLRAGARDNRVHHPASFLLINEDRIDHWRNRGRWVNNEEAKSPTIGRTAVRIAHFERDR